MLLRGPAVQVPDWFSRVCRLNLHNTRTSYSTLTDIIQADPFLRVFVQNAFKDYLSKGGLLGMLTALGWEGFRNRLGEVILFKIITKHYPSETEIDHIQDIIDLEKRFDFLFVEGNSRVFLMGIYLKIQELSASEQGKELSLLTIPLEIDEILHQQKTKAELPDWLIISHLALLNVIGEERMLKIEKNSLSDIDHILNQLTREEFDQYMSWLLRYGHGINDQEFFCQSKVI